MLSFEEIIKIAPLDLLRTFALQPLGRFDPTATLTEETFRKVFAVGDGVCTVLVRKVPDGVRVSCQGDEAERVMAQLLQSLRVEDGHDSFAPQHALLTRLHRDQNGLRLIRVPWLFDVACSAVLQQRVRSTDAMKDWRHIVKRHGTQTPEGVEVFPSAARLASLPSWELESLGIDSKRSRTLVALAREVKMNPLRASMTFDQMRRRLGRIPGVGPWTVETVLGFGAADPDALPLGDLYLPHLVTYALAGEPLGSDERMCELLEPFRGQRFRVARLLFGSHISVPKQYAPRRQNHLL